MNAERLHAICCVLKKEMDSQGTVSLLQQLTSLLDQVTNQPQMNQKLGQTLTQIYDKLKGAQSDSFSPAWRQVLEEIGGNDLLGNNLANQLREIMERNKITLSIARDEVKNISTSIQAFKTAVDNVISGLKGLQIGAEELEPGECELGVLIPREAVHSNIVEFGEELKELDFILGTFSEVASGKRQKFDIKTISSSDLMVFLAALPPVAACIAHAAEKIINIYKSLLEIKKLKGDLEKQGLAEAEMKGIIEHAASKMNKGIDKLTAEVVKEYYKGKDRGRKNELKNAVRIALGKLANRIDQGFNIEIRAEPPKEKELDEEEQQERDENAKHLQVVIEAQKTLSFIKLEGSRLLQLPETNSKAKKKPLEETKGDKK
jgi:hypothetical protein